MVLSAAPLRRLSFEMNSANPRSPSTPESWRIRPTKLGSRPAACNGVGTSVSVTPGASASSSAARFADSAEANSALTDNEWPVNTGTRTHVPDTRRSGIPRIFRLSLRSFCSSSVSSLPSSTTEPAIGSTLNAIGRTYFSGAGISTAVPSCANSRPRSPTASTCEASSSTPATPLPDTAWYVLATSRTSPASSSPPPPRAPPPPRLVVQRLQHRHRGHRRAVRVRDDALAGLVYGVRVDLTHDKRHVWVHAPGGGVVDHERTGRGVLGRQRPRRPCAGREQCDVEAGGIGCVGVLDGDLAIAPGQRAAGRPGGGEEPDLLDRELALEQDVPHHRADLSGRANDADARAPAHRPVPPYTTASTSSESSSNAVCVAATASSTCPWSTITEIRISEVEIISMFTPAAASAEKNRAVIPGCERMPAPISETLPIWSSYSSESYPTSSLIRDSAVIALCPSSRGSVNEISVRFVEAAETFCTTMSRLTCASASASKMRAASPTLSGTPTTVILASLRSCATPAIMACSMSSSFWSVTQVPVFWLNEDRTLMGIW